MSVSVSVSLSSRQGYAVERRYARVVPIRMSVEVASISVASHDALLGVKGAVFNADDNGDEGGGRCLCMELI
jgi:hypothetical protein